MPGHCVDLTWNAPYMGQNHMLVGVSLSAICFYCVGQNRLFLL